MFTFLRYVKVYLFGVCWWRCHSCWRIHSCGGCSAPPPDCCPICPPGSPCVTPAVICQYKGNLTGVTGNTTDAACNALEVIYVSGQVFQIINSRTKNFNGNFIFYITIIKEIKKYAFIQYEDKNSHAKSFIINSINGPPLHVHSLMNLWQIKLLKTNFLNKVDKLQYILIQGHVFPHVFSVSRGQFLGYDVAFWNIWSGL